MDTVLYSSVNSLEILLNAADNMLVEALQIKVGPHCLSFYPSLQNLIQLHCRFNRRKNENRYQQHRLTANFHKQVGLLLYFLFDVMPWWA